MKNAFTLAEVLITLGIIGVVAAITLPSLTAKYQKQLMINQLKTAYSILSNALTLAKKDHRDYAYWTYYQNDKGPSVSSFEFTTKYIKPYIKNIALYSDNKITGCKNITYKHMDGSIVDCTSVNTFCGICGTANNTVQLHLSNGMIMSVLTRQSATDENVKKAEFYVDTNGLKGPNIWGKDIFRFALLNLENGFKFCGGDCHDKSFTLANHCTMNNAYGCADVIITDGWQIKNDYPWK